MATYKILGQLSPASTAEASFSAVPSGAAWIVSTAAITNLTSAPVTVTINTCKAGAASANENTLTKNLTIPAYKVIPLSLGITLAATDVVRVTCSSGNAVAVQLFGSEN